MFKKDTSNNILVSLLINAISLKKREKDDIVIQNNSFIRKFSFDSMKYIKK